MHFLRNNYRKGNGKDLCAEGCENTIFLLNEMREEPRQARKKIFRNKMEQEIQARKARGIIMIIIKIF